MFKYQKNSYIIWRLILLLCLSVNISHAKVNISQNALTNNAVESISFDESSSIQHIQTRPYIHYQGDNGYPPYEYINQNDKPDGFNIELIKAISKKMNVGIHLRLRSWTDVVDTSQNKDSHVLYSMIYSDERARNLYFSNPYCQLFFNAVCRSTTKIHSINDLKGKTLILQKDDISVSLIKEVSRNNTLLLVDNMFIGLEKLSNGEADAAICDNSLANYIIQTNKLNKLKIVDIGLKPQSYCYSSNNSQLINQVNEGLSLVKKEGIYEQLYNNWFSNYHYIKQADNYYHWIIVLIILSLLGISLTVFLGRLYLRTAQKMATEFEKYKFITQINHQTVLDYSIREKKVFNILGHFLPQEGISFQEAIEQIHPDDRAELENDINALIKHGKQTLTPQYYRWMKTPEVMILVECELYAMTDSKGSVSKIYATFRNTTSKQEELFQKEKLFKQYQIYFDNTLVGVEYFNSDGVLVDLNNTICQLFHISDKQKYIQKKISIYQIAAFKEIICPDNIKTYEGILTYQISDYCDEYEGMLQIQEIEANDNILFVYTRIVPVYQSD